MLDNYQAGEVILVAFLFTGLTQSKRRPGLVLIDTGDEDIIVARITSKIAQTAFDVRIIKWQEAGLLQQSVVRLHKINTLEKRLIERRLGKLESRDWETVRNKVKQIWSNI